jgi:hypothetical protein
MADEVLTDAKKTESWFRRNWIKIHGGALVTGWGVFEWMAPVLAGRVHQFVLHIFWGDFMHKLLHISYHVSNAAKK